MDLKINSVDHRSPYPGFSSSPLSLLVSVSTVSLAGLLLLGESPAYSYSATTAVATHETIADGLNTKSLTTTNESELSSFSTFDSQSGLTPANELGLIQETNSQTNYRTNSSGLGYETVEINQLENQLESQQAVLTSSTIDLVQTFDAISAQYQAPFIEIPVDEKDISANSAALEFEPEMAQLSMPGSAPESVPGEEAVPSETSERANDLGEPLVTAQGVYLLQGDESSARARLTASYALTPNVLFGATLDLTTGDAFTDSPEAGFDLNELYVTVSPPRVPSLRLTLGMMDLTSYFDRNSFAKDAATHFFNPVFQTNPALAAAGIGSRPGVLVNWDVTDNVAIRGAAFSSDRDLDEFAFDAAAAEVALRLGNLIVRGTYVTDRDAGRDSGFNEIFQFRRDDDDFGLESDDREVAYGVNAEYFIPKINLGLFARYGRYENQALDRGGNTYSVGLNALDLFFADDRLGLGYGRELSNESLRRDRDQDIPDVLELFYDLRLTQNLRVGASLQGRDGFSETVAGLRVRADFNLSELWR